VVVGLLLVLWGIARYLHPEEDLEAIRHGRASSGWQK
jgi:hypothetical protein